MASGKVVWSRWVIFKDMTTSSSYGFLGLLGTLGNLNLDIQN